MLILVTVIAMLSLYLIIPWCGIQGNISLGVDYWFVVENDGDVNKKIEDNPFDHQFLSVSIHEKYLYPKSDFICQL